jgi:hypothetical protein
MTNKPERFLVTFPEELRNRLREESERRGCFQAELIRELCAYGLEKQKQNDMEGSLTVECSDSGITLKMTTSKALEYASKPNLLACELNSILRKAYTEMLSLKHKGRCVIHNIP